MNLIKNFSVGLLSFLALSPLNAAQSQANALAAQWEQATASEASEAQKLDLAKQLLAYWDARLNKTYQRGIKQYPKSAKQYRDAQRKWIEYRDCALKIATLLGDLSNSERKFLSYTAPAPAKESTLVALNALLTMERVCDLLIIDEQREVYVYDENRVSDLSFFSPLGSDGEKRKLGSDVEQLLDEMSNDVRNTMDINILAGLDNEMYTMRSDLVTKMLYLCLESALGEDADSSDELTDQLYLLFKKCCELNSEVGEAEYVQGMRGTGQTAVDINVDTDAHRRYISLLMILMKREGFKFFSATTEDGVTWSL